MFNIVIAKAIAKRQHWAGMANFAKLALGWQISANTPAWAVRPDKQRKGGLNGMIACHQPVIVCLSNFWGILPMIQLSMVVDFGGKGGQFGINETIYQVQSGEYDQSANPIT